MKLEFKFISLVPTSKFEQSSRPKARCGICVHAIDYENTGPNFQCQGLEVTRVDGKITIFNKVYEMGKLHWCSAFKLDTAKWKKL